MHGKQGTSWLWKCVFYVGIHSGGWSSPSWLLEMKWAFLLPSMPSVWSLKGEKFRRQWCLHLFKKRRKRKSVGDSWDVPMGKGKHLFEKPRIGPRLTHLLYSEVCFSGSGIREVCKMCVWANWRRQILKSSLFLNQKFQQHCSLLFGGEHRLKY